MSCEKIRRNAFAYLEKNLYLTVYEEVEEHLKSCSKCALFIQKLQEVLQFIDAEKDSNFDPYMFSRIQKEHVQSFHIRRPVPIIKILQYASAAVLLATIIYIGTIIGEQYSYQRTKAVDYQNELYYLHNIHFDNQVVFNLSGQNDEQ